MDAVGTAVSRTIGARLDASEHRVGWVFRALRAAHRRPGHEGCIPHAPRSTVPNRDPGIVRINSDPVREQAAVHHLAQNTVARILVDCTVRSLMLGPGPVAQGSVKNRFPSASKSRSLGPLNNWLRQV